MWNEERDATLRQLWDEGIPASKVAAQIGVTKNAVIGRAHRMGLRGRRMTSKMRADNARKALAARAANTPKRAKPKPTSPVRAILKAEAMPLPTAPDLEPLVASVVDLESHHCRWIPGEPTEGFCGREKVAGTAYCTHHVRRAYTLPTKTGQGYFVVRKSPLLVPA